MKILVLLLVWSSPALAHDGHEHQEGLFSRWSWDPLALVVLAVTLLLYARGLHTLWSRAGVGRGIWRWEAAAFLAGWVTLAIALVSPLDAASDVLFSAHMSQHELLMLVGAPLLVLGRALLGFLFGLPLALRRRTVALIQNPAFSRVWRAVSAPLSVLTIHAAAIWIWHVPLFFEAALESEAVHALQHFLFFFTAALFFFSLTHGRYGRSGYGLSALFVFLTVLHTGLLGALLTFAERVWYPTHEQRTRMAGVEPFEDQQLAGLIMWIPAGAILAVVGLALMAAWIGESEKRAALGRVAELTRKVGCLLLLLAPLSGCRAEETPGEVAIRKAGCASCHQIPGVGEGRSRVGPPLDDIAQRAYLGGGLPNTPENMRRWIREPQSVQPGTGMPDIPLSDDEAQWIVEYLYSL